MYAVRSIVPLAFMTLIPLRLYAAMARPCLGRRFASTPSPSSFRKAAVDSSTRNSFPKSSAWLWDPAMKSLSGEEILLIPRLFMALLSVAFPDGSLWTLLRRTAGRSSNGRAPGERGERTTTAATAATTASVAARRFGPPPVEVIALA